MSVTAYWRKPSGVFDSFNVSCGEATAYPSYIPYSNDLGNNINASCINVTSGSTQILTVVTISGAETSSDTISLTALPSAVQLSEYDATTTSVTAQWTWLEADDGVAERFNVYCGSGDPTNTTILVTGDTLYNATCSDVTPGGNVTIIVSSTSGDKTSDNDTIIISAVPEIVQNLIEKEATLDTITATWESPIGDVEFYQITCSGGDAKPERLNHISGQDMYNASCVELTSGEDYTLTVIANSNGKQGEVDNVNIFAVPSAVTLREYDATTTSVTAQWTWSEADDGVAEHFNVYCESGYPTNTTIYVTGDTLYNATCNNVTSGRNVTIVVSSTSGDKTSDNDTIIISAVPEAVQNLIEKNTSNETIKVEWEAAEGYVDFYNVYCPEMPSSMIESDEDSENIYSETCTGLTPGTTYIIAVSSNSNEKEGENKSVTVVTIPNSVQLTEESPTTINVTASWLKPSGEVNSFNITCDGDTQASPSYIQSSDISDTDKIEASCINVIPGSTHVLEVTTVSSGKTSSNSISLTALPEKVQNLTKANATTESITASWKAPVGEVDNYNITCSGGDVTEPVVPDDDPLRASCTGLTPGTMYSITVVAKSKENSGQGEEVNIYSIPEKPTNLELMFGKRSVEANWDQPIGGLTSYYVVLSNTDVVQEKYTTDMSVSFEELNPDSDYTVTITTINNEDTSEAVSKSGKTQEAAPPNATDTPPSPVDTQTTTQSFTVQFSSSYFSEENGKIKNYTVIVSEEFAKDEPLEDSNGNFNNWDKAGRGDTIIPYQAFEFKPYFENSESQNRRKKRETTTEDVTIGEIDCRKGKVDYYCNHWLEDDQTYVYKFYACTDGGCTKSPYSGPIKLEKDYTPLIITLSVIGGVLLIIIIVIVALIFRRRSGSGKRDHSGNNNENLLLGNRQSIKSKSHSRCVKLINFPEHCQKLLTDSNYLINLEYEEIREVGVNQSKDAAIAPVNRTKNRFTNILPYDHTRVKLAPADDEEGSDYINANYMPGYNSPREFIACQGPLPATEDDMWKLIWEQHVATIVMVTQLTERGRVKCHHYWPFDNNPTYYGDIMVTIEKEHNLPHWTIREFKLEYNSRIRHVRHFSYLAWPDHGVPDSTDTILKFVNNVRRQIPKDGTPTLVHCSAGVGRTGTFICLDRLVQHMREHDYVDIFGIVCEMRMSRNLMVQTEKQYIFIHQCVLAILQGHSNTQNEAIYENGGFSAS
ncbi:tyrosine-protein phosphatase 10D-like isoform X2 [Antedon mediterranea]|uniref:tyrosine-protein phosphatase 10D-like isoform X2 n=1 Tax=Antedon mediterranea TaxID=105859 RepID=UPI003AF6ADF4